MAQRPASVQHNDSKSATEPELLAALNDDKDWNHIAESAAERLAAGRRILDRAIAAELARSISAPSPAILTALENRVRHRSLHKDWQYHGLDGAIALRSLIALNAPNSAEIARFVLWRDDPEIEPVVDARYKNPRSWTDFRLKMLAFPALAQHPGPATEKLCRDYLALSDDEAKQIGPPQFEEAGRALLSVSPRAETALELMHHRLQVVQGRAILECLAHSEQAWARNALSTAAPHALEYIAD